jgi:hypothetical protein
MRQDAVHLGAADIGIESEHGIGFDDHAWFDVGPAKSRIDNTAVLHVSRQ